MKTSIHIITEDKENNIHTVHVLGKIDVTDIPKQTNSAAYVSTKSRTLVNDTCECDYLLGVIIRHATDTVELGAGMFHARRDEFSLLRATRYQMLVGGALCLHRSHLLWFRWGASGQYFAMSFDRSFL